MKVLVKSGATERLQWCFTYPTTFERKIALMYEIQENLIRTYAYSLIPAYIEISPTVTKYEK